MGKSGDKGMRAAPMPAWAGGARRPALPRRGRARRSWFWPALLLLGAALVVALLPVGESWSLSGAAAVVDGDTLRLNGERIRLQGLDAPELEQRCTDGKGMEQACGRQARTALASLVAGGLKCAGSEHDRYGRLLGTCESGGRDLGRELVLAGQAVADGSYLIEETSARLGKRGIWAGRFERPADWRRTHGEAAESAAGARRWVTLLEWVGNVFRR